jgi:hypothetical protein
MEVFLFQGFSRPDTFQSGFPKVDGSDPVLISFRLNVREEKGQGTADGYLAMRHSVCFFGPAEEQAVPDPVTQKGELAPELGREKNRFRLLLVLERPGAVGGTFGVIDRTFDDGIADIRAGILPQVGSPPDIEADRKSSAKVLYPPLGR